MSKFYGVKSVDYISHGDVSDPEVICRGIHANYWDLEDFLWDEFKEMSLESGTKTEEELDSESPSTEKDFEEWVASDDAISYIDEFFSDVKDSSLVGCYHGIQDVKVFRSMYRTGEKDLREAYVEYEGVQLDLKDLDTWFEIYTSYEDLGSEVYEDDDNIKDYVLRHGVKV